MLHRSLVIAGWLLLACGPEKQGGSSDGSSSGGNGSTTEVSTAETVCSFVPNADDIQCVSARQMQAVLYIPSYSSFSGPIDELCSVAAVTDDGELQTLSLDCPVFSRDIFLTTSAPHVAVEVANGSTVRLQADSIPNGEIDSYYFMLRDETDALLVAGIDGPTESLSIAPLQVELRRTTCETYGDPRTILQRGALEVTLGETSVIVFGGNDATIGSSPSYRLLVDEALREDCWSEQCTPPNYLSWLVHALFIRTTGG